MSESRLIPYNLDDEAKAELIAYLVASQLVTRALTGAWLTSMQIGESTLVWLCSNGANCPATERALYSELSVCIATELIELPDYRNESYLTTLFGGGLRLDYRQSATRALHDFSVNYLVGRDRTGKS